MTWFRQGLDPDRHMCPLPPRIESRAGDVWLCDECGRLWKYDWGAYDRCWYPAAPWTRWWYWRQIREWREAREFNDKIDG